MLTKCRLLVPFTRGSRGGTGVRTPPPPLKKHKNIVFLSNNGPDSLKNHKATKPAFNVWPSSARQRNAIAFRWRANDGPLLVLFGSSLPSSKRNKKNNIVRVGPPLAKLSGSVHAFKSCLLQTDSMGPHCLSVPLT